MQKTKNNKVLRLMSIVLMFTLVSTCLLGGTLAKYVTTSNGSDTARVAKWGVGAANTINNLFDYTDSGVLGTPGNAVGLDSKKLIAPGTKGSCTFALSGTPEVAFAVNFEATGSYTVGGVAVDGSTVNWPNNYYPVQFSLDNSTWVDLTSLLTSINSLSTNYPAGTAASSITGTIYWRWPYDTTPTSGGNDVNDTALGDFAVTNDLGVALNVAITATQLDT